MKVTEIVDNYLSGGVLHKRDFDIANKYLNHNNILEYLVYVLSSTSSLGASEYIMGTIALWKDFNYEDFKKVLQNLNDHEVGMYNLMVFMGKYLGVDIRPEIHTLKSKHKDYVLNYIKAKNPTLFYFDKNRDSKLLEKFGIDFDISLKAVKNRLIQQGALEAKSVKPKGLDIPPLV